jgi:hypothetical protein
MQRLPPRTSVHVFRLPGWAMALIGIGVGAVLLALGLALFVVLAPVAIGLFFYVRWKLRRTLADLQQQQPRQEGPISGSERGTIIDVDYVVVQDADQPKR